jgi:exonuclease SbcC
MLRRDVEVKALVQRLTDQRAVLDGIPDIPESSLNEANAAEKAIREARLRLEAQQLKATLESGEVLKVRAFIPGREPQDIDLQPGMSETLTSRGSISISHGALSLRVVSGNVDVDQLQQTISTQEQNVQSICKALGVDDVDALRKRRSDLEKARENIKGLESNLKAQLGGSPLEQWNQEVKALGEIPAARSLDVIQKALNDLAPRIAKLVHEIQAKEKSTAQWLSEYGTPDQLLDRIADLRSKWKQLCDEASALQPLPQGYEGPDQFIQTLQGKQRRRGLLHDEMTKLREERGTLHGRLEKEEFSAEELYEKIQTADLTYEHRLGQAQALRRILEVHDSLNDETREDPFERVGSRIVTLLGKLSGGRYGKVEFSENLPASIGNDDINLETELLSKGMKGSLALAVRLAYAEVYLTDMDGFLMLDDPFTELDPDRRRHAAELLKEMAEEKQMILFTCHPEHAQLFLEASSALDT